MAKINFFIQSKNSPASIYVRLRDGRDIDAKAKTKFVINPKDWSKTKKGVNLKDESLKKLDNDLKVLHGKLLTHYNNCASTQPINTQWLKDFISPPLQKEIIPSKLISYFDYYALHKKSSLKPSTHQKLKVDKHRLERFQKAMKVEYFIKDVSADFKLKFEEYCKKEGYAINTIARALKFTKTICKHAHDNGIEIHPQLKTITVKLEKVEKIFLSPGEIEKIQNAELEHDYLINARDWLLISCETGQRVSDFMKFKKQHIRYQGDAPLLEFTQIKTGKRMAIVLSKPVMEILNLRNGDFPRQISDQRYNEYIKEVCKIAGIDNLIKGSKAKTENKVTRKETGVFPKYELMTSHIGRRSFATNNYGQAPTSLLMYMTGHTTETMLLEYIGKTATEKAVQLAEYFGYGKV